MSHLFDHYSCDCAPVPFGGRGSEQITLLLHAGKFGIALIDNHVHESVPHLLRGHLAQVLPLIAAFIRAELDLLGFDCTVKRIEVKGLNVIFVDANFFAPLIENPNPLAEASDFRYFAWHKTSNL